MNNSHPANIRLDEDVLKTSWRRLSPSSSEDVFKTSWSRRIHLPYSYVFRRRLEDVFKTSWSRPIYSSLSYTFKTTSRRLAKTSLRHLEDDFKTFSRRLQDVFKTSLRRLAKTSSRRLAKSLQDLFKTYHRVNLFLLTRFQDVFEAFSKRF